MEKHWSEYTWGEKVGLPKELEQAFDDWAAYTKRNPGFFGPINATGEDIYRAFWPLTDCGSVAEEFKKFTRKKMGIKEIHHFVPVD